MTLPCLKHDERIWGRSWDCEEPGEGVSSGQTSSNDRWLGMCWDPGWKDALHEQKIQSQENKRTSFLGTLPVHVNRRGADASICLPTRPSSTSLLTNLMKANSSQNESVFLNSELFCCKVNKVLQEFLKNLQRCAKKASNLLSIMACFQAPQKLLGTEGSLYLSKSELLCRFSQLHRAGSF